MPKQKINPDHYRVAIFGSARIKNNDIRYKKVYNLAKMIASEGIDIVTGGGPGLMDAASRGHHAGRKNKNLYSIGLTIDLPKEQGEGYHLDIKKEFHKFSNRLDSFMRLSNAVIVTEGGIGTLLELVYAWQLVQVKHICETPIVLIGKHWQGLLNWIRKEMMSKKLIGNKDMDFVFLVNNNKEAMGLIKKFYKDFKEGKHVCSNLEKYG